MRGCLEQIELALLFVPVSPDALEDGGAVVEGMRHEPKPGVVVARELAFEKDPRVRMDRGFLYRGLGLGIHTH